MRRSTGARRPRPAWRRATSRTRARRPTRPRPASSSGRPSRTRWCRWTTSSPGQAGRGEERGEGWACQRGASGVRKRAAGEEGTDVGDAAGLVVDVGDLLGRVGVEVKDRLSKRRLERLLVVVAGLGRDAALLVDLLGLADDLGDDRVGDVEHLLRDGLLLPDELRAGLGVERVEEREEARRDALLAVGLDRALDDRVRQVVAVREELGHDAGLTRGRGRGAQVQRGKQGEAGGRG